MREHPAYEEWERAREEARAARVQQGMADALHQQFVDLLLREREERRLLRQQIRVLQAQIAQAAQAREARLQNEEQQNENEEDGENGANGNGEEAALNNQN